MKIHGMVTLDKNDKPLDYWKIARKTAPLLWPENLHLKARVFAVGGVLISARVANLMVPQFYKGAIDTLSGVDEEPAFPTRSHDDLYGLLAAVFAADVPEWNLLGTLC